MGTPQSSPPKAPMLRVPESRTVTARTAPRIASHTTYGLPSVAHRFDSSRLNGRPEVAHDHQEVTVPSRVTTTGRLGGVDRYDTAVQVAKANFTTPGLPVVYVASGENFPDALSAVPVAAAVGAPLLLVASGNVPSVVLDELNALQPKQIILLGGPQAISPATYASLTSVSGLQKNGNGDPDVVRLAGPDRYETSIAIGDTLYGPPAAHPVSAYVASSANFPDAISAASAA